MANAIETLIGRNPLSPVRGIWRRTRAYNGIRDVPPVARLRAVSGVFRGAGTYLNTFARNGLIHNFYITGILKDESDMSKDKSESKRKRGPSGQVHDAGPYRRNAGRSGEGAHAHPAEETA